MKKLSPTIIITLSIISQNSFAERSGLFAGVDLTNSTSAIESQWTYKTDKSLDKLLRETPADLKNHLKLVSVPMLVMPLITKTFLSLPV